MLWMLFIGLVVVNSQFFEAGIKRSTPFTQSDNNYTISSLINSTDLEVIISIATFTSLPTNTSCFVYNRGQTSVGLTCTNNLQSFFYLFYIRSPMLYSNHYDHYFYEGNQQATVKWYAPINQTIISRYQMRAFLTTVVQIDALNIYASVRVTQDCLGFNISRSSNVRRIGFYFIIIQTSYPYDFTFQKMAINYNQVSKLPISGKSICGIQTIYVRKDISSEPVFVQSRTGRRILDVSQNIQLEGFIMNLAIQQYYCKGYYVPSQQLCNQTCTLAVITRTFNNFTLKYCVINNTNFNTYRINNFDQALNYTFVGCKNVAVSELASVKCTSCGQGFVVTNQKCVCSIGTCSNGTTCQPCNGQICPSIAQYKTTISSKNLTTVALSIRIDLAQNVQYLLEGDPKFEINAKINNLSYRSTASYNTSEKLILITFESISTSSKYIVSLSSDTSDNQSSLFLVKNQNTTYLWTISIDNIVKEATISTQSIINQLSPALSHSQKTLPVLLFLAFLIGQKINAFSFFQTVSILYLITFINLDSHYQDLSELIRSIFIFQPTSLFKIIGSNSYLSYPSVDISKIHYDAKIFIYTQGQYYLGMGANGIITLILEIVLIYCIIKLLRKLFSPSQNQILPNHNTQIAENRYNYLNIRRSAIKTDGQILWISKPQPKEQASITQSIYLKICIIDSKKETIFLSIFSVHMISHSFLILYEFSLPLTDDFSIYSRLASSICFLFILILPGLLINHQPLQLLKATGIIYKRKKYKIWQIWLYFYSVYIENVLLPLAIILFSNGALQILTLSLFSILKYIILRKVIKRIDAAKQFATIFLFITLILTFLLPIAYVNPIKQAIIAIILLILFLEGLKLLRSILIIFLNLFKQSTSQPQQSSNINENSQKSKLILPSQQSETNPIDIQNIIVNQLQKIEPFVIPNRPKRRRIRFKPLQQEKEGEKPTEVGNHQEIN